MTVHRTRRGPGGFTMIELLAVIAILGLLATLVAVSVVGQLDKAKVRAAKIQIRSFQEALSWYHNDNGRYPRTDEGLEALVKDPEHRYLTKDYVPVDPWKHAYEYLSYDPNKYTITCWGADGEEGGTGKNADITNETIEAEDREAAGASD